MKILASLGLISMLAQVCPPCSPCNDQPPHQPTAEEPSPQPPPGPSYEATPPNSIVMAARWRDASHPVNVDIDWRLPTGAFANVARTGTSVSGLETIVEPESNLSDGIHVAKFELVGSTGFATIDYRVVFPGFGFERLGLGLAPLARHSIVLDRRIGRTSVLFNSWLSAAEAGAGSPTGFDPVEFQAAWRNSTAPVNIDLSILAANGRPIDPVFESGTALIGFERVVIPEGAAVPDGLYRLKLELRGTGQFTDVTTQIRFLGVQLDRTERLLTSTTRRMDVNVANGFPSVLASDW